MLEITLQAQDELLWIGPLDDILRKVCVDKDGNAQVPLYHQYRTYKAETPLIINTHNTGTGKTQAALLRMACRAGRVGFDQLRPNRDNVLFIAPTNELLLQHARDIEKFCAKGGLPYRVLPITRKHLDDYRQRPEATEEMSRPGAMLHMLLNNARMLDGDRSKRATVYVVNPDIFYYAFTYCYNQFDNATLFRDFLSGFQYIVIDELHYYSPKQLATFLFFIKLSQHYGYVDSETQRQFCLLTATPRPQVKNYLERLGLPIAWIEPGRVPEEDWPFVRPTRALTPVQLELYSRDELQEDDQARGLLLLAMRQRQRIRQWLDQQQDGAIISSSLGTINTIYKELKTSIKPDEEMGRVTGAEQREYRQRATKLPLILATPTVDIGYNFERGTGKQRQNIDFLLIDAFSADELVQRIGRAGRVLGKSLQGQASTVLAVVEGNFYKELISYAGPEMTRTAFARLAEEYMPKRNDLFAYIASGALIEAFRTLEYARRGTSDAEKPEIDEFFMTLQDLFGVPPERRFNRKRAFEAFHAFDTAHSIYQRIQRIPPETFAWVDKWVQQKPIDDAPADIKVVLKAFGQRLSGRRMKKAEVSQWLLDDFRKYAIERARFSFRESFEPPLALVYDPEHLHSSEKVATYNALHIMRYYDARYYHTPEEWQQDTRQSLPERLDDIAIYCQLHKFRDPPLRIALKLDASEDSKDEWEHRYAYRVTALYGLEIVAIDDHHGLQQKLINLLRPQFVPAFVACDDKKYHTANYLRRLQRQGRFFPLLLHITFRDKTYPYLVVLGTMAFHVCAEVPYNLVRKDRLKTQQDDSNDTIFLC
jgi:CRISPR-associated endonuclease/helicase Cas3